jgi:hypothetical protein
MIEPIASDQDENLVRNTFWDIDAKVILAIPLRDDFEDLYALRYEENGIFTVKYTYKLYVQLRDDPRASSSNPGVGENYWKNIWQVECPPKVR